MLIDLYWGQPFTWLFWNGDWQCFSLFSWPKFLLLTPSDSNLCVTQLLLRNVFSIIFSFTYISFFSLLCFAIKLMHVFYIEQTFLTLWSANVIFSDPLLLLWIFLLLFSYLFWHLNGIWGGERGKHRCSGFWPIFWPMYDLSCCSLLHYILSNSEVWS